MAKKKKKKSMRRFKILPVSITIFVLCFICIGLLTKRQELLHKRDIYAEQQATLQKEKEAELQREIYLKKYEMYVQSFQFIEDTARDKFGLVYPDEIVIKVDKD